MKKLYWSARNTKTLTSKYDKNNVTRFESVEGLPVTIGELSDHFSFYQYTYGTGSRKTRYIVETTTGGSVSSSAKSYKEAKENLLRIIDNKGVGFVISKIKERMKFGLPLPEIEPEYIGQSVEVGGSD